MSGGRQFLSLLVAGACALTAACGSEATSDEPWAQPAVELFEEMGGSYHDHHAIARFFSAGGSLDCRAWGWGGVATDPLGVANLVADFPFVSGEPHGFMDVETRRIFVGRDVAAVEYFAWQPQGYITWIQLYAFGSDSTVNSRVYAEGFPYPWGTPKFPGDHELYDRYIAVWSGAEPDRADEVYGPGAELRHGLSEATWTGLDEIAEVIADAPPIDPGSYPRVWGYHTRRSVELLAYVQTAGECPTLELHRWVVEDGRIVDETVLAHVDSVRRCGGAIADGWWQDFEPLPATDVLVADTQDLVDRTVELVNATSTHVEFADWLFEQFAAGGMETPDVAAVWFPPHVDCPKHGSFALRSDDRYGGRHSVTLCFEDDEVVGRLGAWSDTAVRFGLHELGHAWMYDHLTDDLRTSFVELAGLDVWRAADVPWGELGVEHAAETIAWGLAGDELARYDIEPRPSCDELRERFELLTGRSAVTRCDGEGGGA